MLKFTFGAVYKFVFYIDGYNLVFSLLDKNEVATTKSVYPAS